MSYAKAADKAASADRRTESELLADISRSLAGADEISTQTLQTLNGQTEQLERIESTCDGIEHDLNQSDWLLRGMTGWRRFGWARKIFNKEPQTGKQQQQQQQQRQQAPPPAAPSSTRPLPGAGATSGAAGMAGNSGSSGSSGNKGPYQAGQAQNRAAERLLADDAARRARQDNFNFKPGTRVPETEKAYNDIENMLDGLAHKSLEISRTLDHHNQMLPGIAGKVDRSEERMAKQKETMRRLA